MRLKDKGNGDKKMRELDFWKVEVEKNLKFGIEQSWVVLRLDSRNGLLSRLKERALGVKGIREIWNRILN